MTYSWNFCYWWFQQNLLAIKSTGFRHSKIWSVSLSHKTINQHSLRVWSYPNGDDKKSSSCFSERISTLNSQLHIGRHGVLIDVIINGIHHHTGSAVDLEALAVVAIQQWQGVGLNAVVVSHNEVRIEGETASLCTKKLCSGYKRSHNKLLMNQMNRLPL